jgi:hypothetical protein
VTTPADVLCEADLAGAGVVGEEAGPQDRPVKPVAGHDVLVGRVLGPQVRREDLVDVRVVGPVQPNGADLQEPPHAGLFGRVGVQDGRGPVDGVLACRATAWPGTGREHDGVGPVEDGGHVVDGGFLEVEHRGVAAGLLDVVDMLWITHDADDVVTSVGEQLGQPQCDLPVPTSDDNLHAAARICS